MNLNAWIAHLHQLHVRSIDLELGRMQRVATLLDIQQPACPIITVAGTNGKGSVLGFLEAYYLALDFKVAAYTSPYLISFNEQFRVNQQWIADEALCHYFEIIDQARGDITLTLFEFKTLAAFLYFRDVRPDMMILEIGLGGRLDSVNMLDPDVAVITSIGLDHCDWLGDTREKIAREKAGIFRLNTPAVCGDLNPPATIDEVANDIGSTVFYRNKHFHVTENHDGTWNWNNESLRIERLPQPLLLKDNIATAIEVIYQLSLQKKMKSSFNKKIIHDISATTSVAGRQQIISHDPFIVVDVSHNEDSVRRLVEFLKKQQKENVTVVFSVLKTKDLLTMAKIILPYVSEWHIAEIQHPDAMPVVQIQRTLSDLGARKTMIYPSITEAYKATRQLLKSPVVVFGSFHVVGEVLACHANNSPCAATLCTRK